jgi:ATP-dependent Lon protease
MRAGITETPKSYSADYGFVTDYFCEIPHELRLDVLSGLRDHFSLIDEASTIQGVSGCDQRAVLKTARP